MMKSAREVLKEFSRKTGITDLVIDQYFEALEETTHERIERYAKETGITDPFVDYFAKKMIGNFDIDWAVMDEATPDSDWQWIPLHDYHMHSAQRDIMESKARFRFARNTTYVVEDKPAWFNFRDNDLPEGLKTHLDSCRHSEKKVQDGDNRVDKTLDILISRTHKDFIDESRGFSWPAWGGSSVCEPSRRRYPDLRNYIDGDWKEAPKKLEEPKKLLPPTSQTSENSEDL